MTERVAELKQLAEGFKVAKRTLLEIVGPVGRGEPIDHLAIRVADHVHDLRRAAEAAKSERALKVKETLMEAWKALCDDASNEAMGKALSIVGALYRIGDLDDDHAELWRLRITKSCPGHDGSRRWCGLCGELPPEPCIGCHLAPQVLPSEFCTDCLDASAREEEKEA